MTSAIAGTQGSRGGPRRAVAWHYTDEIRPGDDEMATRTTRRMQGTTRARPSAVQSVIDAIQESESGGAGRGGVQFAQRPMGEAGGEQQADALAEQVREALRQRAADALRERLEPIIHDRVRQAIHERFATELRNAIRESRPGRFD